jgi:hypothetical protein
MKRRGSLCKRRTLVPHGLLKKLLTRLALTIGIKNTLYVLSLKPLFYFGQQCVKVKQVVR